MRRIVAMVASASIVFAGAVVVSPGASATKVPFKNCSTFNAKYPTGVARSTLEATAIAARGFERPSVNRKVYAKARKANKRLGTPADGVICEVPLPVTAPSAPRDVVSSLGSTRAVYLQWNDPESNGNASITGYVVRGPGSITVQGNKATVSGLNPDTEYTFEVRAVNVAGEGAPAALTVRTNAEAAPAPTAPSSSARRYANCSEARAAGVTPIRRGTPMYDANRHLDRDGDGVACE